MIWLVVLKWRNQPLLADSSVNNLQRISKYVNKVTMTLFDNNLYVCNYKTRILVVETSVAEQIRTTKYC